MQIVIPMSGFGERFRAAGYAIPKPLIQVDRKTIIAHVLDMFPGESDILFICNQEHLDNQEFRLEQELSSIAPTSRIAPIPPHKLGPVHAVTEVFDMIADQRPVVVNYCDFTCYWDWQWFRRFVLESGCSGAIPAYRGFHPHSLGSTNYAYMREEAGWLTEIQEKKPFTADRMNEFASSGTYYFASGEILKRACRFTLGSSDDVGGEFYFSHAYRSLLDEGLPVAVFPIQHFMQWGTPEDLDEYRSWSDYFQVKMARLEGESQNLTGNLVLPMAGRGQRFKEQGFNEPKPFISVSGKPMAQQVLNDLSPSGQVVAVLARDCDTDMFRQTEDLVGESCRASKVVTVADAEGGQAVTAMAGLEALETGGDAGNCPVTFSACDTGIELLGRDPLSELASNRVDLIVWITRRAAKAIRNPEMFGWVRDEGGWIIEVGVKEPLDSPIDDGIMVGTFSFRTPDIARECIGSVIDARDMVNGEYYLDSCVAHALASGLRCKVFEPRAVASWGTPDDLETYRYWQSCFHKWCSHPYRLEGDPSVPLSALERLDREYAPWRPPIPGPS